MSELRILQGRVENKYLNACAREARLESINKLTMLYHASKKAVAESMFYSATLSRFDYRAT